MFIDATDLLQGHFPSNFQKLGKRLLLQEIFFLLGNHEINNLKIQDVLDV